MDRYEVMSVSKREPPLLPLFLFVSGGTERGKLCFYSQKIGQSFNITKTDALLG
jgi:hypothetical protein